MRARAIMVRSLALLAVLFIALGSAEMVVRLFSPQMLYTTYNSEHPGYVSEIKTDRVLGWSLKQEYTQQMYANTERHPVIAISHNADGYRMDHEVDTTKKVVMVTGDSLTYGVSVGDADVVTKKLAELLGEEHEVINLAVPGFGTDQGYLRFKEESKKYKPDVVVHQFFTNDFSNVYYHGQHGRYKPYFRVRADGRIYLQNIKNTTEIEQRVVSKQHPYGTVERLVRRYSHLYNLVAGVSFPEKKLYDWEHQDGQYWAIEKVYRDKMEEAAALVSAILNLYRRDVEAMNATFVIVLIPDRLSVDPVARQATMNTFLDVDENDFDFDKPYRLFDAFTDNGGYHFVNLYNPFKQAIAEGDDIYLTEDHHLNAAGHFLYAEQVAKYMRESGVIDENN